jgi:hypothetical protein
MEGMNNAAWRKSSYSGGNGGGCVEVGNASKTVIIRDTKDRDGAVLHFGADAWRAFVRKLYSR